MSKQVNQVGELMHVDPNTLVLETNIRTVEALDKGFVDSIRLNGVLQPVTGWRAEDGTITVRMGQRRTKGAQEAGVATIPVYVVDIPADEQKRLVEQIVENDQREQITDGERIEAWHQMELAGMSTTAIAKATGAKRDNIKQGLTIAAVPTLTEAMHGNVMTLDQAATLTEFTDDEEVMAHLTEVAMTAPGSFSYEVSLARRERDLRTEAENLAAEFARKGYTVLSEAPDADSTLVAISSLSTEEKNWLYIEDIEHLPGIAVLVEIGYNVRARYYLDNPTAHGLTVTEPSETGTSSGPVTDEQKEERKTLIANNKAWDAAEGVRREWLTTLISRKTLPKNTNDVIAKCLTNATYEIADMLTRGGETTRTMLGIDRGGRTVVSQYLADHPTKAQHVTLAMILGAVEDKTSRETWRYPSPAFATYLTALSEWGYTLSDVEKIAAMIDPTE